MRSNRSSLCILGVSLGLWIVAEPGSARAATPACGDGYCSTWAGESCDACAVDCCPNAAPHAPTEGDAWDHPWGERLRRGFTSGLDLSVADFFDTGTTAFALDLRFGYQIDALPFALVLEGDVGLIEGDQFRVVRAGPGVRVGAPRRFLRWLEPWVFGHGGVWTSGSDGGPGFDVGAALDVRVADHVALGVRGAFNWAHASGVEIRGQRFGADGEYASMGGGASVLF